MTYTALIPKPYAKSVNGGRSPLHLRTVLELIGAPCVIPPKNGGGPEVITNKRLRAKIETVQVHDHFKVTGHALMLRALKRGFDRLKVDHPDLYKYLGSAGGLNVRFVRGSTSSWSNHAFGFAVDLTIAGELDQRGDDKTQAGLLVVYSYLKAEGFFWGTEFGIEDSMHYEISDELVREWHKQGILI
jgi:hypothetical protein